MYPGSICQTLGISKEEFLSFNFKCNLLETEITNGFVLEILNFAKVEFKKDPPSRVSRWLSLLVDKNNISTTALQSKIYRILSEKKKKGGKEMKLFLSNKFLIPVSTCTSNDTIFEKIEQNAEKSVMKELQQQLSDAQCKLEKQDDKLKEINNERKNLKRKLQRSIPKMEHLKKLKIEVNGKNAIIANLEKKKTVINRAKELKTDKLAQTEKEIQELKALLHKKREIIDLNLISDVVDHSLDDSIKIMNEQKKKTKDLIKENEQLKEENHYLITLLNDNKTDQGVHTWDDDNNCYTPQLVNCIMKLLNFNISTRHISKVIEEVCHLCNVVPNKLPSRQTIDRINDSRLNVATKQMGTLIEKENLTLYSDETSKYSKNFEVFSVTDKDRNSYILGLREMHCKSSATVLDTFKSILNDIDDNTSVSNDGLKLLANIKNTMSDRAATEKKFHDILENYRTDILPKVTEGWENFTDEERSSCTKMNNFFCTLHLLVNFADVCAEALTKFEKLFIETASQPTDIDEEDDKFSNSFDDCGTIGLIRMCCKAFAKGADEQSGVYGPFRTHMNELGDNVNFIRYRHNRFNIFFLLGHITYHHRHNILNFLENVHGMTNRLLSAIVKDIKKLLFIAGCRALGIISKCVCAPLWRDIEDESHVLILNERIPNLLEFFSKAKEDSSPVITGQLAPFPINHDDNTVKELLCADDTDTITVQMLQCLFEVMETLLKREAADHLPGGNFCNATPELWEESVSTLKHNKVPEFFFGQLDYLMKYRPNATTLSNHACIVFSHNKTSDWLDSLDEETRNKLLVSSKKNGREIRLKFKERMKEIEQNRLLVLRAKEEELKKKKLKTLQRKENMTNDILYFGLWQSSDDVSQHLSEFQTKSEKIRALKAQLNFRKNVLKQKASDKKLYIFSAGKRPKRVEELQSNLVKLIEESRALPTTECAQKDMPLLVGKYVSHTFANGKSYVGKVLSVVPGFSRWFNIKYENDDAVYVYKLIDDYQSDDLEILLGPPEGLNKRMLLVHLFSFKKF